MKRISTALKAHVAQVVTTLTTCWLITRLDGMTFAFTSFDEDLVVSGVTYRSTAGFSRSAVSTGSTGQVDNLQVLGYFDASGITEQDMKNGLFDFASVYLFAVNWADLTMGICKLRRGWLGECTRAPNGAFEAELRGLTQALVQEFGNMYMPLCRADLGDTKCKIPIKPGPWSASFPFVTGAVIQAATQTDDGLRLAIFKAQNNGTTGTTEPVWNTAFDSITNDNGIAWKSIPWFRGIGSVVSTIDAHRFTTTGLPVPGVPSVSGNTAVISVRGNISAGTTLEFSDGIHNLGWRTGVDIKGLNDNHNLDGLHYIFNQLTGSVLEWSVSLSDININITNLSGQPSSIIKTGDSLGSIVILPFQTYPLDGGTITWISGANAGTSMELKTYDPTTGTAVLWLGMAYPIAVGDRFYYYPGCDKRRDTCANVYFNILNFRGEPDMPGMDSVLSYPNLTS